MSDSSFRQRAQARQAQEWRFAVTRSFEEMEDFDDAFWASATPMERFQGALELANDALVLHYKEPWLPRSEWPFQIIAARD